MPSIHHGVTRRLARVPGAVALVAIGLVAPCPASAQAPDAAAGAVRGTVVEAESARPVAGATVRLVAVSDSAVSDSARHRGAFEGGRTEGIATVTDPEGGYRFAALRPGPYRIEVSGLGYRATEVWIDLPPAWEVRRSLGLVVEPVALEAMRVELPTWAGTVRPSLSGSSGARMPRPPETAAAAAAVAYTLDSRVLDPRALPGVGTLGEPDVFRALQRLPGVSGRGDFSANVWTRSAPWGMTQILLDGLPLYDPLHLGGIAAGMTADGLGSVALMPGVRPASSAVGAAGTISLSTRPAAGRATGSVALSSMAVRARLEDRWLADRVGLAVSARRSWWDILEPPGIFTGAPSRGSIDYRFADVSGRFDARLGALGRLEAGGLWETDHLDGDIRSLVSASSGEWGNRLGWVRVARRAGPVRVAAMAGRVDYDVRTRPLPWASFLGPDGVPSFDLLESHLAYRTWDVRIEGRHGGRLLAWAAGFRSVDERLEQSGVDVAARELPGVVEPARLQRQRLWGEANLTLGDVDLAGGASLDVLPDGMPPTTAAPSARVRWTPRDWLSIEIAHGGAVQFAYPIAPTGVTLGPALATAYEWVLAGETTPPLTSRTSSLSAETRLPRGVTARAATWWRRIDGVWMGGVRALDGGEPGVRPVMAGWGHERGRGLEIGLGWQGERVGADVAYTLARSRFAAAHLEGDVATWPSPAERRHALDLQLSGTPAAAVRMGMDLTVESGWPVLKGPSGACPEDAHSCKDFPEGAIPPSEYSLRSAPAYASLDAKVEWERSWTHWSLGITGSLRNVLGRNNAAAFRAGTCQGAELVSPVCDQTQGMARFSPGLTRPTPSLALQIRF
jgi:hypothetical protein